jgi:hypothetical protein
MIQSSTIELEVSSRLMVHNISKWLRLLGLRRDMYILEKTG